MMVEHDEGDVFYKHVSNFGHNTNFDIHDALTHISVEMVQSVEPDWTECEMAVTLAPDEVWALWSCLGTWLAARLREIHSEELVAEGDPDLTDEEILERFKLG